MNEALKKQIKQTQEPINFEKADRCGFRINQEHLNLVGIVRRRLAEKAKRDVETYLFKKSRFDWNNLNKSTL